MDTVEAARPAGTATGAEVAIVGISFRMPGCADWPSLTEVLVRGADCVGPLPAERAAATNVHTGADDKAGGWLADIVGFDHRYFGMSRGEAQLVDPRQRLMLQLATDAIGNAGYSPAEMRARRVSVLVAAHGGPSTGLYDLLTPAARETGMAFAGSLHAFAAGRLSYHLDLRGSAQAIDTACSSFLVALHEARHKLIRGECELALVGGCELVLGQPPRRTSDPHGLGVESADDRCRPFDAAADGAGFGEGGGFVLLKPLTAAIADHDVVHAVIRGSAVNQDGGQANGIAAPSPRGQAEVLTAAWADAGIDTEQIGYVEAHGTGTKIGDPIEVQGLAEAFERSGRSTPCLISSVKGSFGHLSGMAGFAGLLRVIAQFRAGRIFPTAHFRTPNPLLGLEHLPIEVAREETAWPADPATPRIAGISGFGLSGTNAHIVVADLVSHVSADPPTPAGSRPILVSARDAEGLRTVLTCLRQRLLEVAPDAATFAAVADVLMFGREHFPYRWAAVAEDVAQFRDLIARTAPMDTPVTSEASAVVLSLGDTCDADIEPLQAQAAQFTGIARVFSEARAVSAPGTWTAAQRHVVALAAQAAVLQDAAVPVGLVLSHGAGAAVARWLRGEQTLATCLLQADALQSAPPPNADRLDAAIRSVTARTVVDLTPEATLSKMAVRRIVSDGGTAVVGPVSSLLVQLHLCGHRIDWTRTTGRNAQRRIELPVPPPAAEPCWPETVSADRTRPSEAKTAAPPAADLSPRDFVLAAARDVLKEQGLSAATDFFDAGGNSLNGSQLINRINERFGTDLDVQDLFETTSLTDLASRVAAAVAADTAGGTGRGGVALEAQHESAPLSGQQMAIWTAIKLSADAADAYQVPAAILLTGEPQAEALIRDLDRLVATQPMLRCGLDDDGHEVRQVVHPVTGVVLQRRELDLRRTTEGAGRAALMEQLEALIARPAPVNGTAPARYELIRVAFADRTRHILLLTFHHLFFDGWSWRLVLAALGGAGAPAPRRHYLDYVASQRLLLSGARGEELKEFWSGYLRGASDRRLSADVPTDIGPAPDLRGAGLPLVLSEDTVQRLRAVAHHDRVTPQMVLLAAWSTVLWRMTGVDDHCVAMPVSGRQPADEDTIGCYVNTVLVRLRMDPGGSFARLLTAVRDSTLQAIAHADLPTDDILRIARSEIGGAVSTTMFDYQSGFDPIARLGPDGPAAELLDLSPPGAKYALNVTCIEYGDQLHVRMEYSSALFHRSDAQGWLDVFAAVLRQVADAGTDGDLPSFLGTPVAGRAAPSLPEFRF
jgi:acyl transferase domain-containing protein